MRRANCHPDRKHYCKGLCAVCYSRARYLKNKEARLLFQKAWRVANPEHNKQWFAKNPEYSKLWQREHKTAEERMFNSAKNRARKKDIPFEITIEDIVIPEFCPCLGLLLERARPSLGKGVQEGRTKYSECAPSLDRILPEKGYVKGNVWVISLRANRIKNSSKPEELKMIYEAVKHVLTLCSF